MPQPASRIQNLRALFFQAAVFPRSEARAAIDDLNCLSLDPFLEAATLPLRYRKPQPKNCCLIGIAIGGGLPLLNQPIGRLRRTYTVADKWEIEALN